MSLTDTAIRTVKRSTKPFKMYDSDGLFLLVNPGGSKLWRWRYRFEGKEKLMALGEYPLLGLAQARERHLAARKTLALGVDPMAERKAQADAKQEEAKALSREAENSFEKVARKWWACSAATLRRLWQRSRVLSAPGRRANERESGFSAKEGRDRR